MAGMPGTIMETPFAQNLSRLAQETELQKILTDERIRNDQHKTNYQHLKAEHERLQEDYLQVQSELRTTIEESKLVQDKYKSMYAQASRELSQQKLEMDELHAQIPGPQKFELMRLQMSEDIERPYKEKLSHLEAELDGNREAYNKLRYELAFIKTEYEHEHQEHHGIIQEVKLQHDAEVSNLRKERELIITKIQSENTQDSQRVRVLQRENAQLHLKMKGLLTELEEIRAQREQLGLQSDNVSRIQAKQLTEHAANVKALEAERGSLQKQLDNVQKEFSILGENNTRLTSRIHELEKDNIMSRSSAEEMQHKGKVDITNLKIEMVKQKGDLERERDRLSNQVQDLDMQQELSQHKVEQQEKLLVEKEREAVRRVQAAREEEWDRINQFENEKLELESKLQELERRRIDDDTKTAMDKERMEERVRAANDSRDTAERDMLVMKARLQNQESLQSQLDRERSENSELKNRMHHLETELSSVNNIEQEANDIIVKLRHQLSLHKDELRQNKDQLSRAQDGNDRTLAQQKVSWTDERSQLEHRIHSLEERFANSQGRLSKLTQLHKKYKKKCLRAVGSYKNKIQLLEARVEEQQLEKVALQKCVPQDQHQQLRKQLKDLNRRHSEFRNVILASSLHQVPIGDMSFASVSMPMDFTDLAFDCTEQDNKHKQDLKHLRKRIDLLDNTQQQQLEELDEITRQSPRYPRDSPPSCSSNNNNNNNSHHNEITTSFSIGALDEEKSLEKKDQEKCVL